MPKQTGIALITALLIVALATITAVSLISAQHISIRRTENVIHGAQARLYTLGAEAWAKQVLWQDQQDSQIDELNEAWATQLPPSVVEGGTLLGTIEDLQARFNLNSLINEKDQINPVMLGYLQELFLQLEIPNDIVYNIVDWIDNNKSTSPPYGAEQDYYLTLDIPYRNANHFFYDLSELRLVAGVDAEIYQKLRPYLCVLPRYTAININTASAMVLKTLSSTVSEDGIQKLIHDREKQPFKTINDFAAQPIFAGTQLDTKNLAVNSQFFLFTGEANIGQGFYRLYSFIERSPKGINSYYHSRNIY